MGSPPDHYFSAHPTSAHERRTLSLRLGDAEVTVETASGVFSGSRLDLGTEVLLRSVPEPPGQGHLLDLGCGWGPIALTLALRSPAATVWAVDVNERALELTARNARRAGLDNVRTARPEDVPPEVVLGALWSNPPIRVGKAVLHPLLLDWLGRLGAGGEAHLVVQRNLGADSLQRWLAESLPALGVFEVERRASAKGFRVLEVRRSG